MVRVRVHTDAREVGIVHPAVCIIRNVRVVAGSPALDPNVAALMELVNDESARILARPEVRGFRQLFARLGYPDQLPAGERLLRTLATKGFPRYNNVVDAYNIASALCGAGLGLHDASALLESGEDLQVYLARGDEVITPLFKAKGGPVRPERGDLVYGFESPDMGLMAWLGKRDVDSDNFKVGDDSTSLVLLALGNARTGLAYNQASCLKAVELLERTCPAVEAEFLETVGEARGVPGRR